MMFGTMFTSCSSKNYAGKPAYQFKSIDGNPDYSNLYYWAAHPWKWDTADSIPEPLRKKYNKDSLADVFFLHPTSLIDFKDQRWNAPLDDAAINGNTDYRSILNQASAFSEKTRVFAPRYRQAHVRAYYTADTARAAEAFEIAYQDIKAAFVYYLDNMNKGRPIIIASHSQGTSHAIRLMKEFFQAGPLKEKLVCAYLIGMPVKENHFTNISPCKDSTSTGCFVSWRTYRKGYEKTDDNRSAKISVTNPLQWTTTNAYAPLSKNKGSVLLNFNKVMKGVTDAQVHDNILWSSKPKFFGNIFLTTSNYHIADINFFYVNIAENVKQRISTFIKK